MSTRSLYFPSMFLFFITLLQVAAFQEGDLAALQAFKSMISHDPQGILNSWNDSRHFCEWEGITCGRRHRRVTALDLRSKALSGLLSPQIGNLSFLREINLMNNTIQGEIPLEFGRLHSSNNRFTHDNLTGGIPPFIGNITSPGSWCSRVESFWRNIPDSLVIERVEKLLEFAETTSQEAGKVMRWGFMNSSAHCSKLQFHLNLAEKPLRWSLYLKDRLPTRGFCMSSANQLLVVIDFVGAIHECKLPNATEPRSSIEAFSQRLKDNNLNEVAFLGLVMVVIFSFLLAQKRRGPSRQPSRLLTRKTLQGSLTKASQRSIDEDGYVCCNQSINLQNAKELLRVSRLNAKLKISVLELSRVWPWKWGVTNEML
ncbi:hypothetical protein CUMW_266830 [Citrus unshiu]|uniref:Leucine-rich repeat-containing N-terminal plant-type domain-containing protein n=1 Tax=Citrus unshiu TaxID=55188 RepID=A0A2H5QWU2_CITUN|nr:hypothetical protein CUMW_266830 [Citrus unshiu]